MLSKLGVNLAVYLLGRGNLSVEDANRCAAAVLDGLHALPLSAIIEIDDQQQLVVNGKPLDIDAARSFRENARSALQNRALTMLREQVAFTAVTNGVHKAETPVQMLFARAALWYHQQLEDHLRMLAGRDQEPHLIED